MSTWNTGNALKAPLLPLEWDYGLKNSDVQLTDAEIVLRNYQQAQYVNYMHYITQMKGLMGSASSNPLGLDIGFEKPMESFAHKMEDLPPGRPVGAPAKAEMTYGDYKRLRNRNNGMVSAENDSSKNFFDRRDSDPRECRSKQMINATDDNWDDPPTCNSNQLCPAPNVPDDEPVQKQRKTRSKSPVDNWEKSEEHDAKVHKNDDWNASENPSAHHFRHSSRGGFNGTRDSYSKRDRDSYSKTSDYNHSRSQSSDQSFGNGKTAEPGKRKFEPREGDWECPGCKQNNFTWRRDCFKCHTARPEGAGAPPRDGYQKRDYNNNRRGNGFRGRGRNDRGSGNRGGRNDNYRSSTLSTDDGWGNEANSVSTKETNKVKMPVSDGWDEPEKTTEDQKTTIVSVSDGDNWDDDVTTTDPVSVSTDEKPVQKSEDSDVELVHIPKTSTGDNWNDGASTSNQQPQQTKKEDASGNRSSGKSIWSCEKTPEKFKPKMQGLSKLIVKMSNDDDWD